MAIAPPTATITISGATGTITGDMSQWTVTPGLRLYPGSVAGPNGQGREIATYTQVGTTGATCTFRGPFDAAYSAVPFYITEGAPSGTAAYLTNQMQRLLTYFGGIFGPDLSIDSSSQQLPLTRVSGAGTFARLAFYLTMPARVLSFLVGQRSIGSREALSIQASPDGAQLIDALVVDRATGGVTYRSAEGAIVAAATTDLGSVFERRAVVSGNATISSFGTTPNQEKWLRFGSSATLVHGAGLTLPGGANIVTAAGDTALAVSDAAGNWIIAAYTPFRAPNAVAGMAGGHVSGRLDVDTLTVGVSIAGATFAGATGMTGYWLYNAADGPLGADGCTWTVRADGQSNNALSQFAICYYGSNRGRAFLRSALPGDWSAWREIVAGAAGVLDVAATYVGPTTDNAISAGRAAARYSTVYAGTGSISTSDARLKTPVAAMSAAEIAWAKALAAEIGTYQWLDAIADKGADRARLHVGLTVQRAIELGQAQGLDPMRYAFICHDSWPAEPGTPAVPAQDEVRDADGRLVSPALPAQAAKPGAPAGDLYSFRPDQLALFVLRGQEARLAALEAALAA